MYFHVDGEASAVLAGPSPERLGDGELLAVEFQGWLGDGLLDVAGAWIVSGDLADALRASDLTGTDSNRCGSRRTRTGG